MLDQTVARIVIDVLPGEGGRVPPTRCWRPPVARWERVSGRAGAAVRDEANRVVFDQKYAPYRLELASIPKPPANEWTWITAGRFPVKVHTDEWMDWQRQYGERYEHLAESLKGMDSIQKRFDQTETGPTLCSEPTKARHLGLKAKLGASALLISIALTPLTGCGMNEDKSTVPSAGTSTSRAAADEIKKLSSEIYDLVGVKGEASDANPGVMDCAGRDREKYFRVFHSWSFYPASPGQLDEAMERLKAELPKNGWKISEYGPDTSKNRNLSLTADNDAKKTSVNVSQRAKNDPPKLSLMLVSGCYEIPAGQEIERF
ncbi:hypothetical protein LUX12_10385 [Streptomyces somaliensis]|uniref:hypothetical protein n=1 Tax=Streptomyces somaliensis TaxID=78355 RepID=UPI0020CF7371|nr:hypothetical protein [Streptomyces somaliensis]MCP9945098.1 hypothetical protein [Streptomyces somaliensis]MCP9961686.1 hypothetical protein [Streptomyces somaliensis]